MRGVCQASCLVTRLSVMVGTDTGEVTARVQGIPYKMNGFAKGDRNSLKGPLGSVSLLAPDLVEAASSKTE